MTEFIIKEVNDEECTVISGMDNHVHIDGNYISYKLIGVANVKNEDSEILEKRDFYEERIIHRSAITEIGLTWLHKIEQWEIAATITGSNNDLGLKFHSSDKNKAKEIFESVKQWWING